MTSRESIFIESHTHDIADLTRPDASLIAQGVISGWSKLIVPGPAKPDKRHSSAPSATVLFDLKSDPLEENDLADKRPDEVKRLQAILNAEKAK